MVGIAGRGGGERGGQFMGEGVAMGDGLSLTLSPLIRAVRLKHRDMHNTTPAAATADSTTITTSARNQTISFNSIYYLNSTFSPSPDTNLRPPLKTTHPHTGSFRLSVAVSRQPTYPPINQPLLLLHSTYLRDGTARSTGNS